MLRTVSLTGLTRLSRVHVNTSSTEQRYLESTQKLVNQELHVLVGQLLELDDVVEVGAHQVGHQVAGMSRARVRVGVGRLHLRGEHVGAAMATARRLNEHAFPPGPPPTPLLTPYLHGEQETWRIYSSLKSSNAAAGVKTSSSPMTCEGRRGEPINNSVPPSVRPSVRLRAASTHVLVFHVLEQPQLPVGAPAVDEGLKRPGQLLHRHLLP